MAEKSDDDPDLKLNLNYLFNHKKEGTNILKIIYRKIILNPINKLFDKVSYKILSLFKRSFKVGLISYYYPNNLLKSNNGVAIHVYYLSRELAKLGCDVHVFAQGEKKQIKKQYLGNGKITIHRITTRNKRNKMDLVANKRLNYFIFDNKVMSKLTKENSKESFNIIHTHGYLTSGAFLAKHLNNLKWIHTFHALEKNRLKFMSKEEKRYFSIINWMESNVKDTNAIICVSKALRSEVQKIEDIKKSKIFYIPNGVDLNLFNEKNKLANTKDIVYVGRFSLDKGIDLVPKIVSRILEETSDTKFFVVADDSFIPKSLIKVKTKFEKLVEDYPDRFIWHQKLSREELADLYKKCAIGIQPSRYESFGLCVLEEMACGNVVVCTNRGGLPEVVGDSGIKTIVNSKIISNNILSLLNNDKQRRKLMVKSINRSKQFDWKKIGEKTLELYRIISKSDESKKVEPLGEGLKNLGIVNKFINKKSPLIK